MKRILLVIIFLVLMVQPSLARIPYSMNMQGVLTDDSGITLPDGDYTITFQFWDLETEGSVMWTETNLITQTDGVFDVFLGYSSGTLFPSMFSHTL